MNAHFRDEDFSAYIDGELPADRAGLLKEHCAECEECADEVRRLERVRDFVVENDPAADVPEIDFEHAVMRRIRTERAVRRPRPFVFQWRWAALAACAVIAVVFGVVSNLSEGPVQKYAEIGPIEEVQDFSFAQPEDWLVAVARDEEDVDLIIAALIPEDMVEIGPETDEPWFDSSVDELVETLTVTEIEDLREELYDYATQG